MWSNLCPANVDILGAEDISLHLAVMLTTDLNFATNVIYSSTDVFNKLNQGYSMNTRSSVSPKLSINTLKRGISSKWIYGI